MTKDELITLGVSAKKASYESLSEDCKNSFLITLASIIRSEVDAVLCANEEDMSRAKRAGLSTSMLERLKLSEDRIEAIAAGLDAIIQLPDPVGNVIESTMSPDGLHINKVTVPIGVVAIIYESRPNVTIDCAALLF